MQTGLFLHAAVAVIPVRARLAHWKPIGECRTRLDATEAQSRDSILVRRQTNAVPVNRGWLRQPVGDQDDRRVPLAQTQDGPGRRTVHGSGHAPSPGYGDRNGANRQIKSGADQSYRSRRCLCARGRYPSQQPHTAQRGNALDEPASGIQSGFETLHSDSLSALVRKQIEVTHRAPVGTRHQFRIRPQRGGHAALARRRR